MNQADHAPAVVGPVMRKLLHGVFLLFAILILDSVLLVSMSLIEWFDAAVKLNEQLYLSGFLVHLIVGFSSIIPTFLYALMHMHRAWFRRNRHAVRLGIATFASITVLLVSGVLLTRGIPVLEVREPLLRSVFYWIHVGAPVAVCVAFVLHRLQGRPIQWAAGRVILGLGIIICCTTLWLVDDAVVTAPPMSFEPSLARTKSGHSIDADDLMMDEYCARCHADIHEQWQRSAHRFSSFNNPAYKFSVRNTRNKILARDGDVSASRFCAGCHDPVPLFSGAFDRPDFDDVSHPTANAGITCVVCHSIVEVPGPKGNADYVIDAPAHYPLTFSDNWFLQQMNGLLIKGKPGLHKQSFLKPLHQTSEFCATCHKVHIPVALNHYRWLRGQNNYDSFLSSGVSGHSVRSFYYPEQAIAGCNECHMQRRQSIDFAAELDSFDGQYKVHDHQFAAANTLIPLLAEDADAVDKNAQNKAIQTMLEGALRVDIFAIRQADGIDSTRTWAPLDQVDVMLESDKPHVLDVVIRNLRVGHKFTEGTADSNQVWLEVIVQRSGEIIAHSGLIDKATGMVDPFAHYVNSYVVDRDGNRITQRNVEDIFTALYDHQIPPGAADVVHYRLPPLGSLDSIEVSVRLRYRKFATPFVRAFQGDDLVANDLPIITVASDRLKFASDPQQHFLVEAWERWNDYGIGLLRKHGVGELRQAEAAFAVVETLGRAEGPLNLVRVYFREGRLEEAAAALSRARAMGGQPWVIAWFSALIDMQNGFLDEAIGTLESLVNTQFAAARARDFDFSFDSNLQATLAQALFEKSRAAGQQEKYWLGRARDRFEKVLQIDPEHASALYALSLVVERLGEPVAAERYRQLHAVYRRDDNAHDRAMQLARERDPAANHAANAIVVYSLQPGGVD